MDEVAQTDRACFIFAGRKLAEGTPAQLTDMFDGRVFFLNIEPSAGIIREINQATPVRAQRFGAGLHLYTPREMPPEELVKRLQQIGIDSRRLTPMEAGLEDTFIQFMEMIA
jgi:ABC-2 type transport system ATP-binding protein